MRYLFILALLCACVFGQTMQFEDVPGKSGLQTGYNRFTDQTVIATKREVVSGITGKKSLLDPSANSRSMEIFAAVMFKGRKPESPINEIILGILPEATTKGGRFTQGMERGPLYVAPDAAVIVIADGERFELGRVTKADGLDAFGHYNGAAFVSIPLATFQKIANAKKLEMAAGSIEIRLYKRIQERFQALAAEVQARKSP